MLFVESVLALLAPHECLGCASEGALLCDVCAETLLEPVPVRCYKCLRLSRDAAVCQKCRRMTALRHVWVATEYNPTARQLVRAFKYERAKEAYKPIARHLQDRLPYLGAEYIVTHIPTATSRHRLRGYDQSQLVARAVARHLSVPYASLLERKGQSRQVGSTKTQRVAQAKTMFYVSKPQKVTGKHILLIDDVLTTGASLEAAARLLKAAGASRVNAAVFAQKH